MKYVTIAAVAAAVLAWSQLAYARGGGQPCATEGGSGADSDARGEGAGAPAGGPSA